MPKISIEDMTINYCVDDLTDPWRVPETVQTVLMHHGSHRNLKFWTPWVATLARKYRVIRYDAPGFGESSWPKSVPISQMRYWMFSEMALKFMDKMEIKQVHWVGSLSGGTIGCLFAVSHPERIRSLTLCNTPYKMSDEYKKAMSAGYTSSAECKAKLGVRGWREKVIGASLDMTKADPRMAAWTINEIGKTGTEAGQAYGVATDPKNVDLTDDLARIKCPTLLMNGDRSIAMSPEMMVFMYRHIPNAQLLVFPGLGGGIDNIIPDRCARSTLDFITDVDSKPH